MKESVIRELIRFQDLLHEFVPWELWHAWAIANENIIDYLEYEDK